MGVRDFIAKTKEKAEEYQQKREEGRKLREVREEGRMQAERKSLLNQSAKLKKKQSLQRLRNKVQRQKQSLMQKESSKELPKESYNPFGNDFFGEPRKKKGRGFEPLW